MNQWKSKIDILTFDAELEAHTVCTFGVQGQGIHHTATTGEV